MSRKSKSELRRTLEQMPESARLVLGCLVQAGGSTLSSDILSQHEESLAEVELGVQRCDQRKAQAIVVLGHGTRVLEKAGIVEFDQDPVTSCKTLRLTEEGAAAVDL